MARPEIKPAYTFTPDDETEFIDAPDQIGELLERYRRDRTAMPQLRSALLALNEHGIDRRSDHEVIAIAHAKLKGGHLKAKKDVCDRRDDKNRRYRDFIDAHRADALRIALTLKTNLENILGLSALESTFGSSRFARQGNNFFGLHGSGKNPLPNQKGLIPAAGDPAVGMAVFDSYLTCADSFAKTKGQFIVGVTDAMRFATILQNKGKFGIGPNGPIAAYPGDVVNVIGNVRARLACI